MLAAMWTVIAAIFVGAIVGFGARLILPGKQNISVGTTVFIGFIAALVGGAIAHWFGLTDTDDIDWIKLFIQFGVAVVMIGVWTGYWWSQNRN